MKKIVYCFVAMMLLVGLIVGCAAPARAPAPVPAPAPAAPPPPPPAADTILYNGKVITVDKNFSIVNAVGIWDGKFVAVGSDAEVKAYGGPKTKMIDLKGKTVVPGLIDGHLHQFYAAEAVELPSLAKARSIADVVAIIEKEVAASSPGKLIVTSMTWHESQLAEGRLPTRWELDPVSPNNPVIIPRGGHVCTCNSKTLELVGITKDKPDPAGGTIVRDPKTGEPTGVMLEAANYMVKGRLIPPTTYERTLRLLPLEMKALNSVGLTGVFEPSQPLGGTAWQAYMDLWKAGKMTIRTCLENRISTLKDVQRAIDNNYTRGFGDDMLFLGGFKYWMDGGVEGAYLIDPYEIVPGEQTDPNYRGQLVLPPGGEEELQQMFNLAAKKGIQFRVHGVGDACIRKLMDMWAKTNKITPVGPLRNAVTESFLIDQYSLNIMKEIGIVAQCCDHAVLLGWNEYRYWGSKRAAQASPIRDIIDNGIVLSGGTDAPVVPASPFISMWWMVTKGTFAAKLPVLGPEQAITREQALHAYTINNAWCMLKEDKLGSIEVGKLADLVVCSDDILTCPKDKIKDITPVMTILGGKIVYEAK